MQEAYYALIAAGLLLLGIEIFVPGGILGMIGGVALFAAMILGFHPEVFGLDGGMLSAVLIALAAAVYICLIIKYLPSTPIGKVLTLSRSTADFKAPSSRLPSLEGRQGVALTDLRPGGFARIDGKRTDVVAEGQWISAGAKVQVIAVQGSRVVVKEIPGR